MLENLHTIHLRDLVLSEQKSSEKFPFIAERDIPESQIKAMELEAETLLLKVIHQESCTDFLNFSTYYKVLFPEHFTRFLARIENYPQTLEIPTYFIPASDEREIESEYVIYNLLDFVSTFPQKYREVSNIKNWKQWIYSEVQKKENKTDETEVYRRLQWLIAKKVLSPESHHTEEFNSNYWQKAFKEYNLDVPYNIAFFLNLQLDLRTIYPEFFPFFMTKKELINKIKFEMNTAEKDCALHYLISRQATWKMLLADEIKMTEQGLQVITHPIFTEPNSQIPVRRKF